MMYPRPASRLVRTTGASGESSRRSVRGGSSVFVFRRACRRLSRDRVASRPDGGACADDSEPRWSKQTGSGPKMRRKGQPKRRAGLRGRAEETGPVPKIGDHGVLEGIRSALEFPENMAAPELVRRTG